MKVTRDLMTENPDAVSIYDTVYDIAKTFLTKNHKTMPVIGEDGFPKGILTEYSLVRLYINLHLQHKSRSKLEDYMDYVDQAPIIEADSEVKEVIRALGQSQHHRVLVKSSLSQKLCGIVSPHDLLKFISGEVSEKDTLDQELDKALGRIQQLENQVDQLEESVNILSTFYENSPSMIHSVDADGTIVMANKKMHQFLRYEPGELVGKKIFEIYPENMHEEVKKGLESIKSEGQHSTVYSIMITKDKWYKPVDISSSALYDPDGNFMSTITISREIKSKELWKALQAIDKMKSKVSNRFEAPAEEEEGDSPSS